MENTRRLWIIFGLALFVAFFILGWFGREIYRQVPPIPEQVVTDSGRLLYTEDDILTGQQVWQSIGGMQIGSIWGHGAYQAPDWTADWLHREATALQNGLALQRTGQPYARLDPGKRASVDAEVRAAFRTNTYDAKDGTVTVGADRAAAIEQTAAHYLALFGDAGELDRLREDYALHGNAVPDENRRFAMTAFFFWTSWAAAAERPDTGVSYTNNWPHEPLVGNSPTAASLIWSLVSVALLLAGIGALVWFKMFKDKEEPLPQAPGSSWAGRRPQSWARRSRTF